MAEFSLKSLLVPFLTGVVAGLVGYFSGIAAVREDLTDLDKRILVLEKRAPTRDKEMGQEVKSNRDAIGRLQVVDAGMVKKQKEALSLSLDMSELVRWVYWRQQIDAHVNRDEWGLKVGSAKANKEQWKTAAAADD